MISSISSRSFRVLFSSDPFVGAFFFSYHPEEGFGAAKIPGIGLICFPLSLKITCICLLLVIYLFVLSRHSLP
nr:hypothetical protein Iba_chr01bCG14140 [Ipomoea batatas]